MSRLPGGCLTCAPLVLPMQGHMNRAELTKWLCQELTRSCRGKVPPLPRDRKPGPEFQAMDSKEAEMQKMLAGMKVSCTSGDRLGTSRRQGWTGGLWTGTFCEQHWCACCQPEHAVVCPRSGK